MESMGKSYEEIERMNHEECEALFFEHYKLLVGDLRNLDRNNTSTIYEIIRMEGKERSNLAIKFTVKNGPNLQ